MTETPKNKGSWSHRVAIGFFTLLFGILVLWLLDFAVEDIGSTPGPVLADVEKSDLNAGDVAQRDDLAKQIGRVEAEIAAQRERRELLRESTNRHEETLRQLVEMERLNSQKGVATAGAQQKALADSTQLFLQNQGRDQAFTDDIAKLTEKQRGLQQQKAAVDERLEQQRKGAQQEYDALTRKHELKLAAFQLLLLVPLLGLTVFLIAKKRAGLYAPLAYAAGAAVLWETMSVVHEHFPTRYFKYVLLVGAIAVVAYAVVWLLRMVRMPKLSFLLKQYRDAYEKFFCPVCDFPIRRGPRRYLFWTRRTVNKVLGTLPSEPSAEEAYTCPACGSRLYEQCSKCHAVRHSLLPYCQNCGSQKELAAAAN
jgi:predicted RNA-binding Zn-ribbon protein involved in translation (DUF1610 family)